MAGMKKPNDHAEPTKVKLCNSAITRKQLYIYCYKTVADMYSYTLFLNIGAKCVSQHVGHCNEAMS